MIFETWHSNSAELKMNKKKMNKIVQRIGNLTALLNIQKWQQYTLRSRNFKVAVVHSRQKLKRKMLRQALSEWSKFSESSATSTAGILKKILRVQSSAIKVCMSGWNKYIRTSKKADKLKTRLTSKIARLIWNMLCAHCEQRRRVRVAASNVCQRGPKMLLTFACTCWHKFVQGKHRRTAKAESAVARISRLTTRRLVDEWRQNVKSSKQTAHAFSFVSQGTSQRSLARVFPSWTEYSAVRKRLRVSQSRVTLAMARIAFLMSFKDWHSGCIYERRCRKRIELADTKRRRKGLLQVWKAWMANLAAVKIRTAEIYGRRAAVTETRLCAVRLAGEVEQIRCILAEEVRFFFSHKSTPVFQQMLASNRT